MRNREQWSPTKFVLDRRGQLHASSKYNRPSRYIMELQAEVYQAAIVDHAGGDLLDMGCGEVPLLRVYEDRVDSITCVDWAESFFANKFIDHLFDLNQPTTLPDAGFDTILLLDVLEHIAEPRTLTAEVGRLLRPGGKAIFTVPFMYCIHAQPYDFHRYTEYALRYMMEKENLEVLQLDPYGGLVEIGSDIGSKAAFSVPLIGRPVYWLGTALRRSWLGRKLRDKTARKFPLGYVMVVRKPNPVRT